MSLLKNAVPMLPDQLPGIAAWFACSAWRTDNAIGGAGCPAIRCAPSP